MIVVGVTVDLVLDQEVRHRQTGVKIKDRRRRHKASYKGHHCQSLEVKLTLLSQVSGTSKLIPGKISLLVCQAIGRTPHKI